MNQIKNRWNEWVICEGEKSIKELAQKNRADLSGADLSRANLSRANLSRANLSRANLSRADLSGAINLDEARNVSAEIAARWKGA